MLPGFVVCEPTNLCHTCKVFDAQVSSFCNLFIDKNGGKALITFDIYIFHFYFLKFILCIFFFVLHYLVCVFFFKSELYVLCLMLMQCYSAISHVNVGVMKFVCYTRSKAILTLFGSSGPGIKFQSPTWPGSDQVRHCGLPFNRGM